MPGKFAAATKDEGEEMRKAIMMMVISAVVGGVVTGICGSIFGTGAAAGTANNPFILQTTSKISTDKAITNLPASAQ